MIRLVNGSHPTPERLARHRRARASLAYQLDVPAECEECGSEACQGCYPRTEIMACVACARMVPLTHDTAFCARQRGWDGDTLYRMEHARERMEAATLAQSRAIIADLTHAVRQLDPEHPVLTSLGCFAPAPAFAEGRG